MSERAITITVNGREVSATLNDTDTATRLWEALPINGAANLWGDEIYFSVPVRADETPTAEVVALGDLGFWPPGGAFCMFFGPTPMSRGDEIRPASAVVVVGKMRGDLSPLRSVPHGAETVIERA